MLTILSLLGGGLMRLVPELFALFNKKTDNTHELAMMDKQLALQQSKGVDDRAGIEAQGTVDLNVEEMKALSAALTAQMQPTGIHFVDALNFLVRPLTTYYFLGIYGAAKFASYMVALQGAATWSAVAALYTEDDLAILSGILAFWFVGRVFEKARA